MKNLLKYGALSAPVLVSVSFAAPVLGEETLKVDPIAVEAPALSYPATQNIDGQDLLTTIPYSDSADYLRSVPGVTAGRFGGHGLELFVRGQSESRLNIVSDDAYVFGGCPNRMDPPTAYLNIQPYDKITVVQGYQSVLNGFGGTGGSVIVEQGVPEFGDSLSVTGLLQGGYDSNGNTRHVGGNAAAGTSDAYVEAYGSYKDAGNYEDGEGKTVRSSFNERSGGVTLGYTPEDTHIYFGADFHEIRNALFPGAGMDSPLSEAAVFKGGLDHDLNGELVKRVAISGYVSKVDHIMDNFSLRPLTAMMGMRVNSESDTYGTRLETDLMLSDQKVETAVEWRRNNRNADRVVNMTGAVQSLLWPDITIDEIALAAETTYDLDLSTRLVAGARYDYVHVDYGRADEGAPAAGNRTPNSIYGQFYGVTASNETEHNLGGLLRLEHDYSVNTMLYAGVSRSVRTADATERGLANLMGVGGAASWVGNPGIDPEKHHQIDAGFDTSHADWAFGGSVYANLVQDYILRDSARIQPGILVNLPGADVYRNIDAFLTGFEMHGRWQIRQDLALSGDATFTLGEDRDADRALPQVPPLQGKLALNWQAMEDLALGTTMRWALQQNRVDTDPLTATGRDVGKTDGYAVLDIEGTLTSFEPASLNFGVTNLFDTTYANHLNRTNISDPTEVQVNEPGRSVYVQLSVPF